MVREGEEQKEPKGKIIKLTGDEKPPIRFYDDPNPDSSLKYSLINEIQELVKSKTNDMELGKEIRKLFK